MLTATFATVTCQNGGCPENGHNPVQALTGRIKREGSRRLGEARKPAILKKNAFGNKSDGSYACLFISPCSI
jgi:hypothetical protein